jgi:3-deoxy-7-phosphoheptulonate synthase
MGECFKKRGLEHFSVKGIQIGRGLVIAAGPCSVESETQIMETARFVSEYGGHILRGGAFKPRTSPYSFQGMGEQGLLLLAKAGSAYGLPIVTEVMDPGEVELVAKYADILQIGSRNMQNYPLLRQVGRSSRAVFLKRGFGCTVAEWISAAEYIFKEGNQKVVLIERGIRTFEDSTRFTLDISAVPVCKARTHLPVFVDPSHAAGKAELVGPLAKAAIAAGADGLIIEVHHRPEEALSDKHQQLKPEEFKQLVLELNRVHKSIQK